MKSLPSQSRLAAYGHDGGLPEIDLHDGNVLLVSVVLPVHRREDHSSGFQTFTIMSGARIHIALEQISKISHL